MNPEEFTEPFDLDRWMAGEPVFSLFSNTVLHFRGHIGETQEYRERNWRMKPRAEENPWIPHNGGECPIPWAKGREVEVKARCEIVTKLSCSSAAETTMWIHDGSETDAVAWRLTNRWIPVKGDGTIPKEIKDLGSAEWEYLLRTGRIRMSIDGPDGYRFSLRHTQGGFDIVAVRLVKKDDYQVAKKLQGEGRQVVDENAAGIFGIETTQQRRTRDERNKEIENQPIWIGIDYSQDVAAYHRFRESPRGKEALAAIGKTKGSAFKPLGEDTINDIAAVALREHDRVWPLKRGY